MAFNKKTWKDRVSEQPQRRLLTPTDGGEAMTVDVTRQEGIVIQEGDAFSAANMNDLETRIKNTFDSDESTLAAVNNKANTNASNISTLQTNLTSVSNRVTTNANNIAANKTIETNHYNALDARATTLEGELTANSKRIYMDYKNGKYGINTSANRGADTFIPFNSIPLPISIHIDGGADTNDWSVSTTIPAIFIKNSGAQYVSAKYNNVAEIYVGGISIGWGFNKSHGWDEKVAYDFSQLDDTDTITLVSGKSGTVGSTDATFTFSK